MGCVMLFGRIKSSIGHFNIFRYVYYVYMSIHMCNICVQRNVKSAKMNLIVLSQKQKV